MIDNRIVIRVRDVMKTDFGTIDGIATVAEALKKMKMLKTAVLIVNKRHDDDEFGFLGHFFRVRQGNGASGDQVGRRGVVVCRQEQAVTGFLQVRRHWVAHDAGADKSDFSHEKILLFLCFL